MTIREFIRLLVPPIYGRLKGFLQEDNGHITKPELERVLLREYLQDIENRSSLPFTEIETLANDINFDNFHSIAKGVEESFYYGTYQALLRYANFALNIPIHDNIAIQHGIVYEPTSWEKNKSHLKNLVWSDFVKGMLVSSKGNNHNMIAIGAPFFYAQSLYSKEDIIQEKKRLGKNLLAIPMHSTHYIDKNYNPTRFIETLEREKLKFDSVRVCLYWKDILKGTAKIYQDAGFECVCSGHIFDLNFLRRQKSLIEISDATISNAVGSHIGYSIYLNKPHKLLLDEFNLIDLVGNEGAEEQQLTRTSQNYKEICNVFMSDEYVITELQKRIVDKYWGISAIKTPIELRHILLG